MEEVKKKKTTAKKVEKEVKEKKVAKTTKKETVKKAAPKKTVAKEEKKATTKKAVTKTTTKKTAVKETPKKETKTTAKKETKVEKKPVAKKTTKKVTKEVKKSFVPDESDIANYMANKEEIDEEIFAKQVYDSTFDYFYGEPYIGADLKFDSSWENSSNELVKMRFAQAKEDAIRIRQEKAEKENNKLPRQVEIDEYSLTTEIATTLHNNWCDNEIKEFFDRAKVAKGNFSQGIENILNAACYKKGKKTNEISINREAFETNKDALVASLDDFDLFKTFVGKDDTYIVEVRKYVKSNLNDSEKQSDFKASTGEENILRPYEELSMVSKNENIAAAGRAVDAYKELASAGKTLEDMKNDAETRTLAGKIIHIGYLEDNKEDKTTFNDLSIDAKNKDLMAFDTLIKVVENAREYTLYPVEGVTLPDYDQIEKDVINGVDNYFISRNKKLNNVESPKVRPVPVSAYDVEKAIEAMEKGIDVLGEGQEEKPKINTMGYVGVWMTAIATAGLTATIFALAAFYLG